MRERLMLKGYRRLRVGMNPELEMGLFLTKWAHFATAPRWPVSSEYVGNDGPGAPARDAAGLRANQGDGWTYSLEYVRRHLEQYRTTPGAICCLPMRMRPTSR